jgi:hypothetical protein
MRKEYRKIINRIQCTKDIKCYESNFENICKAEDIGLPLFLVCLEKKSEVCSFSVSFGSKYYCRCPLRIYAARELKK